MSGGGEKGLLITTASFTQSAKQEATRDGAPSVELIDGSRLCDLLYEYRLGVDVKEPIVRDIAIDTYFLINRTKTKLFIE